MSSNSTKLLHLCFWFRRDLFCCMSNIISFLISMMTFIWFRSSCLFESANDKIVFTEFIDETVMRSAWVNINRVSYLNHYLCCLIWVWFLNVETKMTLISCMHFYECLSSWLLDDYLNWVFVTVVYNNVVKIIISNVLL